MARVTPLFKGNDPELPTNYRPMSVITTLSKIHENFFYQRLIKFLDKNKILTMNQYGFRADHSTAHAIIDINDRIYLTWITAFILFQFI